MNREELCVVARPASLPGSPEGRPGIGQPLERAQGLLLDLAQPLQVLRRQDGIVLEAAGRQTAPDGQAVLAACLPECFGDPSFLQDHGVRFAYCAGAMAGGINSEEMVIALGSRRILGVFGAGGLMPERILAAVRRIKEALPNGPYAVNLLHNPSRPDWEMACVKLFIEQDVKVVEASAYIKLSPAIVYYRVKGLALDVDGNVLRGHRVIAKVSRREVAQHFLNPAPDKIVRSLLAEGLITEQQAQLASRVPMADDITVEGDSGGHTDNGVLSCIFRSIVEQRDELAEACPSPFKVRIGAAGGLGSPHAVLGAFAMGAAYVVTGSINQACVEAGTSPRVKQLLGKAKTSDVAMAPSADMFELGAKVQVLTAGSMYAVRAQKLYSLYKQYESIEAIPAAEVAQLEQSIFRRPLAQVWAETEAFFRTRDSEAITLAARSSPKKKMALLFQWYLGQSSRWAIAGDPDRAVEYQVWCGAAMGAANEWLKGSPLEPVEQRHVADIAVELMAGAAYLNRVNALQQLGVPVPERWRRYSPGSARQADPDDGEPAAAPSPSHRPHHRKQEDHKIMEADTKLPLNKSKDFYKQCWELMPGGTHYNFGDPERPLVIPFNRGRNSRVWDLDGNEHLDLFCKFGALFVGHHNEAYDEALIKYMQKVTSVDICDLEVEVCSQLISHIPCAEMIRFCLSGTEAVQNALRLARGFTGKNRFIRFHGHYHGNADNIMGWRKKKDLSFPVPEQFKGDLLDTLGRAEGVMESQSFVLPWNDIQVLEATIERYHGEIAAVLMEPICINGGGILPREGYLERAKEICEKHNIVLIFDEIITGVRLGLSGAQGILGVTPHLATFGKALGGGSMPISAIAGRRDIMNMYTRGKVIHAGTFNGYPLGLAAVKATFDLVEKDPGCYERMAGFTAQISDAFIRAAHANDLPLVVQGMPTALVYHSQTTMVDRSEGYTDKVKFCDIIIREIAKRYGIQFSPLSRIYSNLLMSQDDVRFFEERIFDALANAKKVIDITFKEGEAA
ncbi:PfaD family polyunsaturated fatty acid/polyketide biosynthesis protein [Aquabacterium sp. A7-Y]|uniref:PfaD family polyunsaturated fatty acid/polyketide biosynthesis protein n=1 Tax=Aquabacterium sp. A7-Y TaxID=1349605 RepID=UPI00223E198D|nr:PfaD family polyunsaturated fatty acid/polyketide biosynthesis protein [Aquabacterium sp. A7-Y]MCW7539469.1 PfaD family polyunsaturated fatty acid/polyketide biosynthesis protein [Aquabacterium sp. A7-Y]